MDKNEKPKYNGTVFFVDDVEKSKKFLVQDWTCQVLSIIGSTTFSGNLKYDFINSY